MSAEIAIPPPARAPADSATGQWHAEVGSVDLRFGAGRLAELGEAARSLGARRALLVSDAGLRRAGHTARAEQALQAAGLATATFEQFASNPSTQQVEMGSHTARELEPDLIVALGGGSAMDMAKAINFVATNGGPLERYWGFGKADRPMLPSIALPTTAGTGSDAQSYALISQHGTGRKMACGDRKARFRIVLIDPELAVSAPAGVIASAGIDALSHAVESWVTRVRNPVSSAWALTAWQTLEADLEGALQGQLSVERMGRLLVASHLAGAAIENSMLGAAHAAANPLTAQFRIPHGEAVGLMLPAVVRHNAEAAGDLYLRLAPGGAQAVARRIEALRAAGGLPERLRDRDVDRARLPELAERATREWTGGFNPRPMDAHAFLELYESTW